MTLLPLLFGYPAHGSDFQSLLKDLSDPDWERRFYAVRELGWMGHRARPAIPKIRSLLKDRNYQLRVEAVWGLARIEGREAIPVLIASLRDKQEEVRESACLALGGLGPTARQAEDPLVRRLEDTSVGVQISATGALLQIGSPAAVRAVRARIPRLLQRIKDVSPTERGNAASLLGAMRKEAAQAVNPLTRQLDDPERHASSAAAHALKEIGTCEALDAVWKYAAARRPILGLDNVFPCRNRKSFIEAFLRDRVNHPAADERAQAALQLFESDQTSEIAKETLVELMSFVRESDDSSPDYLGIAAALHRIGPRAAPLYPALLFDALTDPEPPNRGIAVDVLVDVLPSRTRLLSSLTRTKSEKWGAQLVVQKITEEDGELRAEMLKGLLSSYPEIRQRAAWVSGYLSFPDDEIQKRLTALTRDPDAGVRHEAAAALNKTHGPAANRRDRESCMKSVG